MKKLINFLMMAAMMTVTIPTLVSCGSDDDEEMESSAEHDSLNMGVHRIDVTFSGETQGWEISLGFTGTPYDASVFTGAELYDNGVHIEKTSPNWLSDVLKNYSVTTDDKCIGLWMTLTIIKDERKTLQPMTVTMKGYLNDKLMQERSYTVTPNEKTITHINFASQVDVFEVKAY